MFGGERDGIVPGSRREKLGTYGMAGLLALLVVLLVVFFRFYYVPTASMAPLVKPGSRVLALAIPYGITHRFERGDVGIFRSPTRMAGTREGETLVKRVVAVGGDRVLIDKGIVYVNAKPSPWQGSSPNAGYFAYSVPEGEYFMMGDNRLYSLDSRFFGSVPASSFRARALTVYLPYLQPLW